MLFDSAVTFFSAVYCLGPDEHGFAFHWLQQNWGQPKCKIFGMAEKTIVTVSSVTQESLKPTRHRSGSVPGQYEFYGEVAGALSDRQVAGVSSLVARWDIAQGTVGVIDILTLCVSGTSEVVCPSCSSSGELTARGPVDDILAQYVSRWKDNTHEPVAMTSLLVMQRGSCWKAPGARRLGKAIKVIRGLRDAEAVACGQRARSEADHRSRCPGPRAGDDWQRLEAPFM